MPSPIEGERRSIEAQASLQAISGLMRLAQTQPAQPPAPAATADEPIGNVVTLTGVATVIRDKDSIALKLRDDIFLNDTVQTSASSSLGITFNDSTTFNLRANAKITIDNYIYEDGGKDNAAIFDIAKGTVAFVASAVAKTGNMSITTPTASLGIRGTTGLVEVEGGAAANNIKLYPDEDGRVGRIEVNDRSGVRLGALTQGASGFAIRPGIGGARVAAVPLTISPQQAQRDQGFVRQVHAAQTTGRQIVSEQRAFRRANPGLNNRGNRPGQPGPQRQNGTPGQNRPGLQQPGTPKQPGAPKQPGTPKQPGAPKPPSAPSRQGLEQRPGGPQQPGLPPRAGQNPQPVAPGQIGQGQPGQGGVQPRQGGLQQGAPGGPRPGVQRPALQNRPALPRRPLLPKGKKPKQ
ncbi:FecR domain-containing protein [Bradyrhizobium sp.]|uniref:FecR family protein n=1 Tax=Bradyrhizobium sp. TaxID=376 RepID=UPI003BB09BE0